MSEENGLAPLVKQYREEFEEGVQALQKCLGEDFASKAQDYQRQLMELQPTLMAEKDKILESVQDQSPVDEETLTKSVSTFAWIGVMLMGMSVSYGLARLILAPVVGLFFSGFMAFVAAFFVLPALAYYYVTRPGDDSPENDRVCRHALLAFAIAEGLFTATLYYNVSLAGFGPLPALTPLTIAVMRSYGASFMGTDRMTVLGASLGGGFAAHLVWGLIAGFSMAYFLLAIFYTAIGFVVLQMFFKDGKSTMFTHLYQLAFVCAVVYVDGLVMLLLSGDAEEMAARNADAAAAAE